MSAVKVDAGNPRNANSIKMRALMFGLTYDDNGNQFVIYGHKEKIDRCVAELPGAVVGNSYDALEWRKK